MDNIPCCCSFLPMEAIFFTLGKKKTPKVTSFNMILDEISKVFFFVLLYDVREPSW